ncbi:MAG TPA: Smr/MutS family protein [Sphingobacteriaceae bacterium]
MKFKLGEFVRFVDEKREGYITRIFNEDLIGVTGEDDFEIPVPVKKVTRVHGRDYSGIEDQAFEEKDIRTDHFQTKGVFLAVVPDPSKGSVVNFHVVNNTSFQLLATLTTTVINEFKGSYAGIIAPHAAIKVFTASLSELGTWPQFNFRFLYYTTQNVECPKPLVIAEKFRSKDFSGSKETIPQIKQLGWLFRLDEDELIVDPEKLKESFFKPREEKKDVEKPQKEIDLHIERLRDDHHFLSASEILNIQLDRFRKALDAAIVHKLPSIIFIHGVGNGTLRHEIHKIVGKHPQVRTFTDARKEKFGYGATEVFFK